jgi:transcriptional regulator with XRE-family HTH domain
MTTRYHVHPDALRFGRVIQRLRLQHHWTVTELAGYCGLSRLYIARMEEGRNLPTITTIFTLANALQVKASSIVDEVETERNAATRA